MKPKSTISLGVLLIIVLVWAAACNLSTNNEPPTVPPRVTDTPLPTIGYETVAPPLLTPQANQSIPQGNLQTAKAAMSALLDQVDADHLFMHISTLESLGTRHVNSADLPNAGVGAAYRYVRGQFDAIAAKSAGNFTVTDQTFDLSWAGVNTKQRNIIGTIPGKTVGSGIILLCAHYDSISIDPNDSSYPAPGANDDGSGIAALIEMANILSQRQHGATILFVAFAAEEVGRMGSKAFVNAYTFPINYVLNMDIIGSSTGANGAIDDNHLRIFSAGPESSPSRQLARAVYWIDFTMVPDMIIQLQDSEDRFGRYSDHMSFTEAGNPAIRFIESLEDRAHQHTPQDVIGDVQATYLRRTTQAILAATVVLADGLPPPRNIILRPGEGRKRTLVWEPIPGAIGYKIGLRNPGSLIINQEFPWNTNSVDWDGFYPEVVTSLVISAIDSNGMMGPPSAEYTVPPP